MAVAFSGSFSSRRWNTASASEYRPLFSRMAAFWKTRTVFWSNFFKASSTIRTAASHWFASAWTAARPW